MTDYLKLSDLLLRDVAIEPHEAVAVAGGVIDALLVGPGELPSVPDLYDVVLSSEGQIQLTGGREDGDAVRRLGQLLHALLAESTPPVQLRLVVSQATSPDAGYVSIDELAQALAYFERPDRAAVIVDLFARALASSPADDALGPTPTLDGVAPLPQTHGSSPVPQVEAASRHRRNLLTVGAVAILVVAGLIAAAFGVRSARFLQRRQQVSSVVVKASDAVGSAVVSGVSALTERAGLGRIVPSGSDTIPATARVEGPAVPSRIPRKARGPAGGAPAFAVFDLESGPDLADGREASPVSRSADHSTADANGHLDSGVTPSTAAAESAFAGAISDEAARSVRSALLDRTAPEFPGVSVPEGTIFSSGWHDVAPPVAVRPQLPRHIPAGVRVEDLGRIDLVIREDGTVESVKLLDDRHKVQDAMMLSAAKAWEFRPASRNGRPVRYRKTVWLMAE